MARSLRQSQGIRRRPRKSGATGLNITSMMDMFTIILLFLLKSFSSQGQMVTPAEGLKLPDSNVRSDVTVSLELKISKEHIMVEDRVVTKMSAVVNQKEFLIKPLYEILLKYSKEAVKTANLYNETFKGDIVIQGDQSIPYKLLTRVMYSCGKAGFSNMKFLVYREE